MMWLVLVGVAIIADALMIVWTLNAVCRRPAPWKWNLAAGALIVVGTFVGFKIGMMRYAISETQQVVGFPLPVAMFILEDGQWVDYIGNPLVIVANAFLIGSLCFVPLALTMFILIRRAKPHVQ